MRIIELVSGRLEQHDDGIVAFRPKAAVDLTRKDVYQYLSEAYRLSGGPAYVLIDRRSGYSLSFEAQEILRKEIDRYVVAIAYLAKPGLNLSVVTHTLSFIQSVPAQAFLAETDARTWRLGLRRPV